MFKGISSNCLYQELELESLKDRDDIEKFVSFTNCLGDLPNYLALYLKLYKSKPVSQETKTP